MRAAPRCLRASETNASIDQRTESAQVRIALDSSVGELGGVSRHLFDLGSGLQAAGADVFLSLPADAEPLHAAAREQGLPVCELGFGPRADIVHFHLADTFDRWAVARMVRYKPSARIVVTEHLPHSNTSDPNLPYGGTSPVKTAIKTMVKRHQLALVDRTILPSSGTVDFVSKRYRVGQRRLSIVHNGIPEPAEHLRPSWGGNRVISVGSLSVQKGFDVLTKAASLGTGWTVDIFGEGPSRASLEQLAVEQHSPVRFAGWADRTAMAIDRASVMCVPSRWEAFSYVALEAMWAELPIVASRVDGLTDLVVHGETGLLVEPDDEIALAAAISTLIENPTYARELGRQGRRRAAEHFSYQAMVDGVCSIYREVL
jgi:glycosyltransferase involved in cell wall biosynthesis